MVLVNRRMEFNPWIESVSFWMEIFIGFNRPDQDDRFLLGSDVLMDQHITKNRMQ